MDSYYVRSRGKVAGPFEMDALQQLVKRGKVSRFDQLSIDKASWRNAGEVSELFAAAAARREPAMSGGGNVGGGGGGGGRALDEDVGAIDLVDAPPPSRGGAAAGRSAGGVDFYYAQNGVAVGPVTLAVLQTLATNGTLRGDDQVWADGSDIATPARQVPMLASHFSGRGAMVNYASNLGGGRDAGFWLRAVALLIDSLVLTAMLGLALVAIAVPLGAVGNGAAQRDADAIGALVVVLAAAAVLVIPWLYSALSESSATQATLGKRALGLLVTDEGGGRIGFGRATGRWFGKAIISNGLTSGIGFVVAAFTPRKQALHDLMSSTYVVQK